MRSLEPEFSFRTRRAIDRDEVFQNPTIPRRVAAFGSAPDRRSDFLHHLAVL